MDINRSTLSDLYVGYKTIFQGAFRSREDAMIHTRIATVVPSSSSKNAYPWLGQAPRMRKWLGDRVIKRLSAHRYEIVNEPFEMTVAVDREAIEDDEYAVYNPQFEEMGSSVADWPAEVLFELLLTGETVLCYDGTPFFGASHPHAVLGAVSNLATGSAPPWYLFDTTRPIKPLLWQDRKKPNMVRLDRETDENVFHGRQYIYGVDARAGAGFGLWQCAYKSHVALDRGSLEDALVAMKSFTNDENKTLGIRPKLLVVPNELEFTALELLTADRNDAGATNILKGAAEVLATNLVAE